MWTHLQSVGRRFHDFLNATVRHSLKRCNGNIHSFPWLLKATNRITISYEEELEQKSLSGSRKTQKFRMNIIIIVYKLILPSLIHNCAQNLNLASHDGSMNCWLRPLHSTTSSPYIAPTWIGLKEKLLSPGLTAFP